MQNSLNPNNMAGISPAVHIPNDMGMMNGMQLPNNVVTGMLSFTPTASQQYNDYLSQPDLVIRRLFIQETGTYNDMVHRPYMASVTNDNVKKLTNRVDEISSTDPSAQIQPALLADLCSGLIRPSASHEGMISIPNGWQERRFRFILVVEVPNAFSSDIYVFQGFSEFYDVSAISGIIDPNMVFYINSVVQLQRAKSSASTSGYVDRLASSSQVLDGRILSDYQTTVLRPMRPSDIVAGIQSEEINRNIGAQVCADGRTMAQSDVLSNQHANGLPANYLARTISSYRNVQSLMDFGVGHENHYDRMYTALHERSPYENPFIQRLTDMAGMGTISKNTFTLNELTRIDPMISSKVDYSPVSADANVNTRGASNPLTGATIELVLSEIIANGLASIMIESGLSQVAFLTTSMTLTGQIQTTMLSSPPPMMTGNAVSAYQRFINLFNTTMMPDVSANFTIPFTATIVADIFSDISIQLCIDGRTPEYHVFPAFANSLKTPVVTRDSNNFYNMMAGVGDVMNACGFEKNLDILTTAAGIETI